MATFKSRLLLSRRVLQNNKKHVRYFHSGCGRTARIEGASINCITGRNRVCRLHKPAMTFCDAPHRHDCQTSSTESKKGTVVATQNEQGRTSYLLDQARPIASRLFIHEIVDRNLGCESELASRDFCGRSPQSPTLQTPSAAFTRGPGIFCDAPHRHCCQTSSMESKKGTLVASKTSKQELLIC